MMTDSPACILSLATAVPSHIYDQDKIAEKMIDILDFDLQKGEKLKKLYRNSTIEKRHSILEDLKNPRDQWHFWGAEYPKTVPGMTQRNELYKKEAPKIAHEVAAKAIEEWGGDPQTITHVISVSCTGLVAPGIEFGLIQSLGLKRSVARLGINFMGCFGAFKGLNVAQAFAKESPHHRILVVCTEFCSLHLQADDKGGTLVANSLFSDGAAAAIIGAHPKENEKSWWEIIKQASLGMDDSLEHMSWEASDQGFLMNLSPLVPTLIGQHIRPFTSELLGHSIHSSACDWAVHPGGKAILHAVESKLSLQKEQTRASWNILRQYGNMSSATFLFVLKEVYENRTDNPWTVGIGFGPGLAMEGILLKKPLPLNL